MIKKVYGQVKYALTSNKKFNNFVFEDGSPDLIKADTKYKNIVFVPFNGSILNTLREGIISKSLTRYEGVKTRLLYCDISLPANEFNWQKFPINSQKATIQAASTYCRKIKQTPLLLSNYYTPKNKEDIDIDWTDLASLIQYTYKDIQIGDLAIASTIRHFLCLGPQLDKPAFVKKLQAFFHTAMILINSYNEFLNKERPDKVVSSHGIYIAWGTLFRLCLQKNIPIDIYNSSYRKNTLRFYHDLPNAPIPDHLWIEYIDLALNKKELALIDTYLQSRATQKNDNNQLFKAEEEGNQAYKGFIQQAKAKKQKLGILFTNISWDAYAFSKGTGFKSMIDWLHQSIAVYKENPNSALIIKAHPAEAYFSIPEKYRVRKNLPVLPDNVLFIDEQAQVKPFDIYPHIDYGLTYISTVALEMALKGIPVLTAGVGGQYEHKGFTLDPSSTRRYFEYLEALIKGTSTFKPDLTQAKRFLYYRFFREAIPFEPLSVDASKAKQLNFSNTSEFSTKMPGLKIIQEGILNDAPYIFNPLN